MARQQAPKGGTRIGGKYYKGGRYLPVKYSYGTPMNPARGGSQILQGAANERLHDPASMMPEVAPNYGRPIVPHVSTFQGMITSLSRAYRYNDNALQDSKANAHMMLNDPAIMEPLLARTRITSQLNWHIEPEDENDDAQVAAAEVLTMLLKKIPNFAKYRQTLLWGVWYGRYAIENQFAVLSKHGRKYYYVNKWTPLSGDKLLFRYDDGSGKYDPDQVGIRMSPALIKDDHIAGRYELEPTYETLAYFLKDWERKAFTIHRHIFMDAEYESPIDGGMIHGVGLRNFLYWAWYQKQEAQAMIAEMIERSSMGFTIYYYPDGNAAAQTEVEKIAREQAHTNVITMPRGLDGNDTYGIDQIPPNSQGIQTLQDYVSEIYNRQIKLMIMGQELSSEAKATGMGSGVAGLQKNTLADIISYDATGLEETLTAELLTPLRDFNMPEMREVDFRFRIDTESSDPLKDLQGLRQAWEMGAKIREQDVHDIIGTSAPGEGDTTLYNPVLLQQTRLAEESIEGSEEEGGALSELLGGGEDEPMGEEVDALSPKAESVSSNLIQSFYGDYWYDEMGGGSSEPVNYSKKGAIKYAFGGGETAHAPEGGISIGGKPFEGGQFIPSEDLANATPAEKAMLESEGMQEGVMPGEEGGEPEQGQDKPKPDQKVDDGTDDANLVDFVALSFGKPLQQGSGKFLDKQAAMLNEAGFDIKIPDESHNASERAVLLAQQMESLAKPMEGIIQSAAQLGLSKSKAQGLLYRVNHASNQLVQKAQSMGYEGGAKSFRENIDGALNHLSQQQEQAPVVEPEAQANWGDVAGAAMRLTAKVMKIPLAKKLGMPEPKATDPEGFDKAATDFLKSMRGGVSDWQAKDVDAGLKTKDQTADKSSVRDDSDDGEYELQPELKPEEDREPLSSEATDKEYDEPVEKKRHREDMKGYSVEADSAISDGLGVSNASDQELEIFLPEMANADKMAMDEYAAGPGALSDAIGKKTLKQMRKAAHKAINPHLTLSGKERRRPTSKQVGDHSSVRGFDVIFNRAQDEAPDALSALEGAGDDPHGALLQWLADGPVDPPEPGGPEAIEHFKSSPLVSAYNSNVMAGEYDDVYDDQDDDYNEENDPDIGDVDAEFDEGSDELGGKVAGVPFAKKSKRIKYVKLATKAHLEREDFGYEEDAEQNLNCGNCAHYQAGRCLKFDSMNRSNPSKYDLDSDVEADAGCDLYEYKEDDE